jgi:branched-chain amino acid transport system ATP-binding protein
MIALSVESLTKDFGGLRALDRISLTVAEGERLAIIGPNGAGKTTFFDIITGVASPSAGRVTLFARDVTGLPVHRRARLGLGRTFQTTRLFSELTVLENVLLAVQASESIRFTFHRPIAAYRRLFAGARRLLEEWALLDRSEMPAKHLSYGEQRQLELVLALAGHPKVLLLDEPTAGLSPAETAAVAAMIRRFPADTTILLIEHDMDVAFDLCSRMAVLFQGRILAQGTTEEIRRDEEVAAIYLGTEGA